MRKLKFVSECSTEALLQVFDSEWIRERNCPLGDAVLTEIAAELVSRNAATGDILRRLVPDRCRHDRSTSGTCGSCDNEGNVTAALHRISADCRVLAQTCRSEPWEERLREPMLGVAGVYDGVAERLEKLTRAIIEGDDLDET